MKLAETTLTLYSRRGCHLCEDMHQQLLEFTDEHSLTLDIQDVDQNTQLYERFNTLVPVLCVGEVQVCHYFLDLASLKKTLGILN